MYDLAQLEQAGFKFTPLERLVFENPSFQFLCMRGWPIKWGEITTGLATKAGRDCFYRKDVSFQPAETEKLSPHGAGICFDEVQSHLRSIIVLTAKVARDASANVFDRMLVEDLNLWLSGMGIALCGELFRWARFEQEHREKLAREARVAEVAILSRGYANVVVLLLGKLAREERQAVRETLEADCLKRGVFREGDRYAQYYHLPRPKCMWCNGEAGRSGGQHCGSFGSVVTIDCGDVQTIIRSLPSDVRRIVKPVRFRVPKSTFSDRFVPCVGNGLLPQFAVFSLAKLSKEEQQQLGTELEDGLRKDQRSFGPGYNDCRVIIPQGRQKLNALLLAGTIATWSTWNHPIKDEGLLCRLLGERKVWVDLVE